MIYVDIHSHHNRQVKNVKTIHNVSVLVADEGGFKKFPLISRGIHPWDLEKINLDEVKRLLEKIDWERVTLIGECGFDKSISVSFEEQKSVFLQHVLLSETYQKPLIIHCVAYFNDLFQLRKDLTPTQRWIIHGFRGKSQLANQALKGGFDLSFGEKYNPESVAQTPLENLFVETDESEVNIEQLYLEIAKLKACLVEELKAGKELLSA